ncbi:hypothetical protein Tco_0162213 [Tanacetum coccineum]
MQQFWYTIKKVQDTDSYEFILANKKCIVNAEAFRTILDIYPRVEGVDFADVLDDTTLTFLIDLGYKGPLNRHTNMLKFVRIGEDYHEYGIPIPDVMLTGAIKHSESYQMFIKYSTNKIPPKKSRGKVVKKKVTLYADENIIFDDPDAALELAKSISKTKVEEVEASKKVHATHARIVAEFVSESTQKKSSGRSSKSVVIQDTPSAPTLKPATSKTKLKGAPSLTPAEQESTNIIKPGVPDESTVIYATSSEGTGAKPGVLDEDKDITEEKVILKWGDEQDSEHSDDVNDDAEKDEKDGDVDDEGDDHVSDKQDDNEDDETESNEDDIYKYKILVRKDEDEEIKDAKVEGSDKGDEEITDAANEEAEKTSEAKDDSKKTELPPSSSSLSISLGFGNQFLKLYSDSSLVSTVKDSTDADVSSLLDVPIQHGTP